MKKWSNLAGVPVIWGSSYQEHAVCVPTKTIVLDKSNTLEKLWILDSKLFLHHFEAVIHSCMMILFILFIIS